MQPYGRYEQGREGGGAFLEVYGTAYHVHPEEEEGTYKL